MAIHVALVSDSEKVDFTSTARIAAALQRQLVDFSGLWDIPATINAFPRAGDAPEDYWLINIRDDIGEDARGLHRVEQLEPIALVIADENPSKVSRTCSHELLEMLADPTGEKLSEPSVPPADNNLPEGLESDTPVQYLREICDPCQAGRDSYDIDGVSVCDFCLPSYYNGADGRAFNRIQGFPREVRPGGYVSFQKKKDKTWWQTDLFGDQLTTTYQDFAPGNLETRRRAVDIASSRSLRKALGCKPNYCDEKAIETELKIHYEKRCKGAESRVTALSQLLASLKAAKSSIVQ
jgi:hypothetical protein